MRRAIAAASMGGLLLGGAAATPSFAATSGAGRAPGKASLSATTKTMKTVVYQGYEFRVPASWPVYRLDQHPRTCVRYDVHAVYLGKPGPDMRCPAGLVGRTQTVSFIPGGKAPAGKAPAGKVAGRPGQPAAKGTELQRLSAVHGVVRQNSVKHEMSVALGAAHGATILGTYGTDPAVIEQVLKTLHQAPADAVQTAQTAQTRPAPARPGGRGAGPARLARPSGTATAAQAAPTSTSWPGVQASRPLQIVRLPQPSEPPQPQPPHSVGGFDTCTAPSLNTMKFWRSDYAAVGVYLGGANAACAYGNLSAGWVRTVTSSGWGLLPTYVGPQAPCWGLGGVTINPGKAAAEGSAAAADAVKEARTFGINDGSPIYDDMEAYRGGASCTAAVLRFIGAWDRGVSAAGYVPGVYSSQDSGISAMEAAVVAQVSGFTPPSAVWIALWDNKPTLSDGELAWPLSDRTKQYAGNVNATIHGITLNVDKDIVGGPVAHLPAARKPRHKADAPA